MNNNMKWRTEDNISNNIKKCDILIMSKHLSKSFNLKEFIHLSPTHFILYKFKNHGSLDVKATDNYGDIFLESKIDCNFTFQLIQTYNIINTEAKSRNNTDNRNIHKYI